MKKSEIYEIETYILRNVDESKMTKKAFKELKEKIEYTSSKLFYKLQDFKDNYIHDYYCYKMGSLQKDIEEMKKKNGKTYIEKYGSREYQRVYNYETQINIAETRQNRKSLTTLEYMIEAEENFKDKFKNLISKLIDYNYPIDYNTKIIRIGGATPNEFSFLISTDGHAKEIDARVIYACGLVNAPHYRFITTLRNK